MMDRALKERIIGAVVIVLFVVLVVPVFLDGPANDGEVVSERVPLPGQSEQKAQTIVLERDRDNPVPVAAVSTSPANTTESQPMVAEQQPAPTPVQQEPIETKTEPVEEPVQREARSAPKQSPPATVSSTGMWAVQVAAIGNKENAERLAADLRKQGFAAFLSQLGSGAGQLHRVRIGPQKDRESAEAMAARLAKAGHPGQVVPHP